MINAHFRPTENISDKLVLHHELSITHSLTLSDVTSAIDKSSFDLLTLFLAKEPSMVNFLYILIDYF